MIFGWLNERWQVVEVTVAEGPVRHVEVSVAGERVRLVKVTVAEGRDRLVDVSVAAGRVNVEATPLRTECDLNKKSHSSNIRMANN